MRKRKGFTLIELLVVIAIIALLMAILMPALKRVKGQAQKVSCQARLKQWGLIFKLYADDHDGYFNIRDVPGEIGCLHCSRTTRIIRRCFYARRPQELWRMF